MLTCRTCLALRCLYACLESALLLAADMHPSFILRCLDLPLFISAEKKERKLVAVALPGPVPAPFNEHLSLTHWLPGSQAMPALLATLPCQAQRAGIAVPAGRAVLALSCLGTTVVEDALYDVAVPRLPLL